MPRFAGHIFDVYDDLEGRVLRSVVPEVSGLPDFIKSAAQLSDDDRSRLPDDRFALVLIDGAHKMKKYAMTDKGNTALSVMYFMEQAHLLPDEAVKVAAGNLLHACETWDLQPPEQLKIAAEFGSKILPMKPPLPYDKNKKRPAISPNMFHADNSDNFSQQPELGNQDGANDDVDQRTNMQGVSGTNFLQLPPFPKEKEKIAISTGFIAKAVKNTPTAGIQRAVGNAAVVNPNALPRSLGRLQGNSSPLSSNNPHGVQARQLGGEASRYQQGQDIFNQRGRNNQLGYNNQVHQQRTTFNQQLGGTGTPAIVPQQVPQLQKFAGLPSALRNNAKSITSGIAPRMGAGSGSQELVKSHMWNRVNANRMGRLSSPEAHQLGGQLRDQSRSELGLLSKTAAPEGVDVISKQKSWRQAPYVDVSDWDPDSAQLPEGKTPELTLLEGKYPVDSYDQVKTASVYFENHWREIRDPRERHVYCVKLAERMEKLGMDVPEDVERYGSRTYAADVDSYVAQRRSYLHEEHQPLVDMLLEKRAHVSPDTFAEALYELDQATGLRWNWDAQIADPWYSTFGPSVEKIAAKEWSYDQVETRIAEDDLKTLAWDHYSLLEQCYGEDFASEFRKNPKAMFMKQDENVKLRLARLAMDDRGTPAL